jgi:hypothetical protein
MTTTRSFCLLLELQSDGAQIAGRLRDEYGVDWPFSTWLGLLTLIERLRTGVPVANADAVTEEVP